METMDSVQFHNINGTSRNQTSYYGIANDSGYTSSPVDVSPYLQLTAMYLDKYAVPVIFTMGVTLNITVFCVILRTELKRVSPCLYMASFAVIDTAYLIQKMVLWASSRVYNIYAVAGICQLTYYCHFLTTFLDWWLMVMMLMERTCVLFYRRSALNRCSAFRTKCGILTVSIFSIVSHLYLTWTSAVIKMDNIDRCAIIPENTEDIIILRKVDTVFSFMIPSACLVIMTVVCLLKYMNDRMAKNKRDAMTDHRRNYGNVNRKRSVNQTDTKIVYLKQFDAAVFSKQTHVITTCIVTVVVFLTLCIPYESLKAQIIIMNEVSYTEQIWLQIFSEIAALSFAFKGIIYFTFLKEFRVASWKVLKLMVQSLCCKSRQSNQQITDL